MCYFSNCTADSKYTTKNFEEMQKAIHAEQNKAAITFPVRACYLLNEDDPIPELLKAPNRTLTIWSHKDDKISQEGANTLSKKIRTIGLDKVYVDVPDDLRKKLHL